MILESSMVNGNTITTSLGEIFKRNLKIISSSKSFPANSEIYNQTDCNKKINIKMVNVLNSVFTYDLSM